MRTIKVTLTYNGKKYGLNAKVKFYKGDFALTDHKCNLHNWCTVQSNGTTSIYDCDSGVEVIVSSDMHNIINVILWDVNNVDAPPIAMGGEFDSIEKCIKF